MDPLPECIFQTGQTAGSSSIKIFGLDIASVCIIVIMVTPIGQTEAHSMVHSMNTKY